MIELNGISRQKSATSEAWRLSIDKQLSKDVETHVVKSAPRADESKLKQSTDSRKENDSDGTAQEQLRSIVSRLRMVALRISDAALSEDQRKLLQAELKELHNEVRMTTFRFSNGSPERESNSLDRELVAARRFSNLLENSLRETSRGEPGEKVSVREVLDTYKNDRLQDDNEKPIAVDIKS